MATIAEQLTSLANTKTAIKDVIVAKGVSVADTDPFSAYPTKIGQISGGGATTKYGVSIDNLLGNVDENGNYVLPKEEFVLDLTGVKSIPNYAFFYLCAFGRTRVTKIIADDVVSVGGQAFGNLYNGYTPNELDISFGGLEEINADNVFDNTYCTSANFSRLKKVSGTKVFAYLFYRFNQTTDSIFNAAFSALEEISGNATFYSVVWSTAPNPVTIRLEKVNKIVGAAASYNATFYSVNGDFYLPSINNISGYVFRANGGSVVAHFAAANQAAIEACPGYEYRFGADEIYFDL